MNSTNRRGFIRFLCSLLPATWLARPAEASKPKEPKVISGLREYWKEAVRFWYAAAKYNGETLGKIAKIVGCNEEWYDGLSADNNSEEKLIAAVEQCCRKIDSPSHHWQHLNTDLDRVVRWIPVTARLPEYDRAPHINLGHRLSRDIFVALSDGRTIPGHRFRASESVDTWVVFVSGTRGWAQTNDVTHWCDSPAHPSPSIAPERHDALDELAALSQKMGLYDMAPAQEFA